MSVSAKRRYQTSLLEALLINMRVVYYNEFLDWLGQVVIFFKGCD
ncbi:hypothetical protein BH23CYA1_BH23CYA1_11920 [soil metagenome]